MLPAKSGKVEWSLFDLVRDPQEKENLTDQERERAGRMKAALEAWQKSVVRSLNGKDYAG